MIIMPKISYKKLSSDTTIYPDNPKYEFPKEISNSADKAKYWFKQIKDDFESFEHHKYSSLYNVYGHSLEDNRTMKMPKGGVPMSERYNNMQEDVLNGCQYRIENYMNKQHGGWNIFDKITGDYEIEIIDNEVIEERLIVLNRFTELLNEDNYLKEIDPNTNENAKTQVDPATGEERGIEYLFPYGIENTEELHYTVLELPITKREKISKEDIENLVYKCLYEKIIETEKPANSNILGSILGTYEELRPHAVELKSKLEEITNKINNTLIGGLESGDSITIIDVLTGNVVGDTAEVGLEELKVAIVKSISTTLKDYQDIGKEIKTESSGTYEEVYKTISIKKIMKRVQDEARKTSLLKNKPPSGGKQGGSSWPQSRGGVYLIRITQNPLDILTKTTGRAWGSKEGSCENWDGQWLKGPQSDFKFGNCVAWIFNAKSVGKNNQIGRALLRWGDCYDELGNNLNKKDIGIEQQLYPKDAPWGLNMFKAIAQIVNDNGFFKYHQLNTPYVYEGYSDYQGRGATQIQYNRPRFKGKTIELGENELMAMASNVKLAYATAGWLVSNGNEMVKRTLSQNPVIWLYENPVRRLVNSSLDLEDGRGLIYDLISSDFADFNFLNTIIDTISIYDSEYDMWGNPDNFINVILNHPNAIETTHNSIINNHPGFTELGTDSKLGSIEELIYLDVLNRANRIDTDLNRSLTMAPTNILDSTVSKLWNGLLLTDVDSIENRWQYAINYNYIEGDYQNNMDKKFYKENREMLYAIKNLIFAPNLSNEAYTILLKIYEKIIDKFSDLVEESDVIAQSLSGRLLETIRIQISISACFPFKTPDSWGWAWDEFIINNGFSSDLNIHIMPLKVDDKKFKEDRLSYESLPVLIKICPELFKIEDTKYSKSVGYNYLGDKSSLSNKLLNIYDHVRNSDSMNYLYGTHIRHNINPLNLLRNPIPGELELNGDWLLNTRGLLSAPEGHKYKNFLNDKFKIAILSNYLDSNNDYIIDNLDLLKYSILPDKTFFSDTLLWTPIIRLQEPHGFIESLLKHKDAPTKCKLIGVDLIGSWLVEEKHFGIFERVLYKAIFGKYYTYDGKKRKHNFEQLPLINHKDTDMDEKNWDLYIKESNMKDEIDITLLSICANGLENQTKGIAENPNIPERLQMKLILPEYDLETGLKIKAYGETKWSILSERYSGDYNYYKSSIINKLASNKGASGPCLRYLLKSYHQILGDKLLKNIAKNPNSHLVGPKDYKQLVDNHPIEVLTNETQPLTLLKNTFSELLYDINKIVKKDPYEVFKNKIGNFEEKQQKDKNLIIKSLDTNCPDDELLDRIEALVSSNSFVNYGTYWRAGAYDSDFHLDINSPLHRIRKNPRSSIAQKVFGLSKKTDALRNKMVNKGYVMNWPYGKMESYMDKNPTEMEKTRGISEAPLKLTKPHFIITINNGCFSRTILKGWHITGLPKNPQSRVITDSDVSNGTWSSKELAIDWLNNYAESYCVEGTYYPPSTYDHADIIHYLEKNYGIDRVDDFRPNIKQVKDTPYGDGFSGAIRIEAINYSSAITQKSEIEVFQITEVIKTKEQIKDDAAVGLISRFGVSVEDIDDFLPSWSVDNYNYIGRKKKRGGRWVDFNFNSLQYNEAIGYAGFDKAWVKDLVICFAPQERAENIAKWRLEMSNSKFKTIVRNYLKNKLTGIEDYKEFYSWLEKRKGKNFTSPIGDYNFTFKTLFTIIDTHKLWTKEIVNHSILKLLKPSNASWIMGFPNIKPTSELLNITMIDNEDNLRNSKYGGYLRLQDIKALQEWLVHNYSEELPISYVYEIITWPAASEQIKGYARNIRNQRLSEFIDYQRKLQNEMLEGGAEENIVYDLEEFNAEPEKNINELIIQYCELKHPKDLNKRDALMQNIIYGNEYISIDRMLSVIERF
jgi:hypothetical protein